MRTRWAALGLSLAVLASACGGSGDDSDSSANATGAEPIEATAAAPSAQEATVTTAADPTDDGVTKVLFAGDSLMQEIHTTMTAALDGGAETDFLLSPRLIRDEAQKVIWQNALDSFNPDVVVVIFSHWERLIIGAQRAEDVTDREAYAGLVAFPFTEFIDQSGADLVWLSAPPLRNERISAVYEVLNESYRQAVTEATNATFVELAPALTDEAGTYSDTLTNATGTIERVRNTDGIHLCPGGAVLVAETVLATLTELTGAQPAADWQNGDWRTQAPFDEPGECPAVQ